MNTDALFRDISLGVLFLSILFNAWMSLYSRIAILEKRVVEFTGKDAFALMNAAVTTGCSQMSLDNYKYLQERVGELEAKVKELELK